MEIIVDAARDLYTEDEWRELLDGQEAIVRCRDCQEFRQGSGYSVPYCDRIMQQRDPGDYCSQGKSDKHGDNGGYQ